MADENFIRSGVRTRVVIGTTLLAFLLGGAAVGYAIWQGLVPLHLSAASAPASVAGPVAIASAPPTPRPDPAAFASQQDALEARVAALSERLDSLDLRATAASGNAARAEALLVAFATRRALERGAPLGLLEDQLRQRFGDAQPHAVATVIDAARSPMTLDQLVAELDALAPDLATAPPSLGTLARLQQELAELFVIRRQSAPSPAPQVLLRNARLLLEEGRAEDAMNTVRRLPGASGAEAWFGAVRRYDAARRALDVLETTALIETRGLRDANGAAVHDGTATDGPPEAAAHPAR